MIRRTFVIRVRVTPDELAEIDAAAAKRGVDRSAYLRALVSVDRKHARLLGNGLS